MIQSAKDIREIVQRAIDRGWIRTRQDRELSIDGYMRRQIVEAYHAKGLTSTGRKPAKRRLPQFAGMVGREYHRNYMRAWRAEKSRINQSNDQ